ncbi:camp-dependent protein kinase regulatory subunit [Vararia minispora EC-137]|uniref:Camp-dependent protein kinase regulatory subunit n=1 Tax=Vararia minispora EC-137 TaxID=1314806 RepID=A0ACB8QQK0_9AGAM|nr:camp-dependent protein kinase regulatory subunit [Vararia minispora EC-137]
MSNSTFDSLIAELTRDAQRVQPKDTLQFCANWFQTRLEEQRTRVRDAFTFVDKPFRARFTDPFEPRRASAPTHPQQSPFGTLNVPGNRLISSDGMPDPTTTISPAPTFHFESEPGAFDPYSNFDHITPSQSPSPGDYLHPPGFNAERRTSVSAEPISVDSESGEPLPVFPKTVEQLARIKSSTKDNFLFRGLDEEQETGVLNAMQEMHISAGAVLIRQGDPGDFFYVVESGKLECYIRPEPMPPWWFLDAPRGLAAPGAIVKLEDYGEFGKMVAECPAGASVGELALMYGHPRAASVIAIADSTLWSLDRMTFRTIILKAAHRRRTMYEQFLSSVSLLSSLSATERSKVADALESKTYEDGEAVVVQGEMGRTFFFVEDGEATVTQLQEGEVGEQREMVVGHLTRGDYFGELALLRLAPRAATVSAVRRPEGSGQPKLKVAALDAQAFTRLLGPLREIMERNATSYGSR